MIANFRGFVAVPGEPTNPFSPRDDIDPAQLGMWNVVVLVLMVAAYGYPIAQFFTERRRRSCTASETRRWQTTRKPL